MTTSALTRRSNGLGSTSGVTQSVRSSIAMHEDDALLVQRVATHDQQAFDILYAQYAPQLRRYLAHRLRPLELVDEVLNDTMLVLWQHASRFNATRAPLAAWLYGIARQKARKAWSHAACPPTSANSAEALEPDSPETVLLRQEQSDTLARTLETLPAVQRTAVALVVFEGWSCQDIAAQTGVPVSTVTSRLWRARRRLAACVAAAEKHVPQQGVPPQPPSPSHEV